VTTTNTAHEVTRRRQEVTDLRTSGWVRLVEEGPDAGFDSLPPGQGAGKVVVFIPEQPGYLLVTGSVSVDVQLIQYRQRGLKIRKPDYSLPTFRRNSQSVVREPPVAVIFIHTVHRTTRITKELWNKIAKIT
jgi:hypothetical protein